MKECTTHLLGQAIRRPFAQRFGQGLGATLIGLVIANGTAACGGGKATQPQCAQMLEKYLDMVIGGDPALAHLPPDQARTVREMKMAVKKAEKSYRQVENQCVTEVTKKEFDCAMSANNPDEWQACID